MIVDYFFGLSWKPAGGHLHGFPVYVDVVLTGKQNPLIFVVMQYIDITGDVLKRQLSVWVVQFFRALWTCCDVGEWAGARGCRAPSFLAVVAAVPQSASWGLKWNWWHSSRQRNGSTCCQGGLLWKIDFLMDCIQIVRSLESFFRKCEIELVQILLPCLNF